MTQRDRVAVELEQTERHVRRWLVKLREGGRPSGDPPTAGTSVEPKDERKVREKAVRILSQEVYRGFGPTPASEYLANKHGVLLGRETGGN